MENLLLNSLRFLGRFSILFSFAMRALADHPILEDFDWQEQDFFSLETFDELKKSGSLRLVVLTSQDHQDPQAKWSKKFCTAQGFMKHLLTTKKPLKNPLTQEDIIGFALLRYSQNAQMHQAGFSAPKYYDIKDRFPFIYETLTLQDDNFTLLHFARLCMEIANAQLPKSSFQGQCRQAVHAYSNALLSSAEITPTEEQDACLMLISLHKADFPPDFKNFKRVEECALKIIDLESKIAKYLSEFPERKNDTLFPVFEGPRYARLTLGRIYKEGGFGINPDYRNSLEHLEQIIHNRANRYISDEARLQRASLIHNHHQDMSFSGLMRIKMVRQRAIQRDINTVLHATMDDEQRGRAQDLLEEISRR